jgi:hypothetical protein
MQGKIIKLIQRKQKPKSDEKELHSPRWHGDILKKRRQQMESGQSKSISLSRLKAVLKK